MSDQSPAQMDIRAGKPALWRRISFVWLVPLVMLAASLGVAYQNYLDQGVAITISFENGSGITSETKIRYRDVVVGEVEKVEFADGLGVVLVHARVDQQVGPYLDDDAVFWVVRPDVSVRGITGLDTVLGGVYIEGSWDLTEEVAQSEFTGIEEPPLTTAGQRGTQVVLRAPDGASLSKGAPILHKGIAVGFLETPQLSANGRDVRVTAFIESPYDRRITSATRFWDTSGFSVSVGAGGLSLNVDSIASLIEGGIAFDTVVSGGQPIRDGQLFDIFDNEAAARESLFIDPDRELLDIAVIFDGSVTGLTVGSEVRYRGIRVGEVSDLSAIIVETGTRQSVQLRTLLKIEPSRLGMESGATAADALALLSDLVTQGLRARMITGNILSGSLLVELIDVPTAPPAVIVTVADEIPVLPTTASVISDVAATADDVLNRINNLPVEELMGSAIDLMNSIDVLANSDGLQRAPDEILAILQDVRALIASEAIQGVPDDIEAIIGQIDEIIGGFGGITDQAIEADLVGRLTAAIDTANVAVGNIDVAAANLPAIMAEVEALANKANQLDIDGLVNQTTDTLASIDALIASPETAGLPGAVTQALDEVRGLVADFRDGGAAENLNAALASASEAAGAVETAVSDLPALTQQAATLLGDIDAATSSLPAIMAEIEALTAKANAIEVEALIVQTTETLDAMETLLANPDTAALPGSLSAALDEMRAVMAEVRTGGAIENVNAALNSANEAARAIEEAARSLPALTARANTLATQTGDVLESFGERSRFNAETLATLRDIQAAADAVSSLARAIQRNPNSLITGR